MFESNCLWLKIQRLNSILVFNVEDCWVGERVFISPEMPRVHFKGCKQFSVLMSKPDRPYMKSRQTVFGIIPHKG